MDCGILFSSSYKWLIEDCWADIYKRLQTHDLFIDEMLDYHFFNITILSNDMKKKLDDICLKIREIKIKNRKRKRYSLK